MTLRPVLLVALLQLLPTGAMAEELADVSPPVDLSVTPESARAQRMEKKLKPYVGKKIDDLFSAFGCRQDGYPERRGLLVPLGVEQGEERLPVLVRHGPPGARARLALARRLLVAAADRRPRSRLQVGLQCAGEAFALEPSFYRLRQALGHELPVTARLPKPVFAMAETAAKGMVRRRAPVGGLFWSRVARPAAASSRRGPPAPRA
jgi:hypothetical protein